jgi:hypothetical protein
MSASRQTRSVDARNVACFSDIAVTGCEVNGYDTAILESVWRAFERVAVEFPEDMGVKVTLEYHGGYTVACIRFPPRPD